MTGNPLTACPACEEQAQFNVLTYQDGTYQLECCECGEKSTPRSTPGTLLNAGIAQWRFELAEAYSGEMIH